MSILKDRLASRNSLPIIMAVLPALIFYTILIPRIINLPFADDYEILEFLAGFRQIHGLWSKLIYVLTTQHNEYKLILGHSIFTLQYLLLGHVSFAGLCFLGDMSILCLAIVLWKMFLPEQTNLARRIALFIPVSWLLFQLSYSETLNWAEPALQNLYVLFFSFAAFLLLARGSIRAFAGALICLVFAIAASGNGFFTALAGLLLLLNKRQFQRMIGWICVCSLMALLYAWHYNVIASQSSRHGSIFSAIKDLKVMYAFSFLGAMGEIGGYLIPHSNRTIDSFILGILLSGLLGLLTYRRRLSKNPAVNAAILFVLLTAIGVAGIRSDFGAEQSTSSRYRIYSSLLLILIWYTLSEQWLQFSQKRLWQSWSYRIACLAAAGLSLVYDVGGARYLQTRNATVIQGMQIYEHPSEAGSTKGPVFTDSSHRISFTPSFNLFARQLLSESERDGTYQPPRY